ncbi:MULTISPECIES: hypothetical protein [Paenibacillus]|uniref:hypothetical protein n=1 Tax=Paenibacillus TaxID=44249 RepID=UPI0022B92093|nr:hypothetical protein [Paenibacillus caseinilyticus]MCZ8521535.1 hypothetical protein [Paenibacillus caseinilyticus]
MDNGYKVRAFCQANGCTNSQHKEIMQTIDYPTSFSFALWMNGDNEPPGCMKCPDCGRRMYYYPVTYHSEPDYFA